MRHIGFLKKTPTAGGIRRDKARFRARDNVIWPLGNRGGSSLISAVHRVCLRTFVEFLAANEHLRIGIGITENQNRPSELLAHPVRSSVRQRILMDCCVCDVCPPPLAITYHFGTFLQTFASLLLIPRLFNIFAPLLVSVCHSFVIHQLQQNKPEPFIFFFVHFVSLSLIF